MYTHENKKERGAIFSVLLLHKVVRIALVTLAILILVSDLSEISTLDAPTAFAGTNSLIVDMISRIDEQEIYSTAYSLQNFTTRRYGYPGNTEAASYIYNRLGMISGLSVEYQSVYNNIIATLAGTDTASDATYMVGAHYDSTSSDPNNAPGATDNGGGVAIVLEFARIMSQYRFNHTIKFAFWNCEENNVAGSYQYANYAKENGANIALYVNFDSSCYDPYNRMILDLMSNQQSAWVSDMMTQYNALYATKFTLEYNAHTCTSDYRPFWDCGYTAIMTHSEAHGPTHSPNDTVDQVSTAYAKKNAQLVMSVTANLAEVGVRAPVHDIAVRNVNISKSVVGKGFAFSINITVWNEGTFSETLYLTTYANRTVLNRSTVTLANGAANTLTLVIDTATWIHGNYTINVCADIIPGENDTADNNQTCNSPVHVGVPGDVSSSSAGVYDRIVNMRDINYLLSLFSTRPNSLNWKANADVNNDRVVNIRDITIAIFHFNETE